MKNKGQSAHPLLRVALLRCLVWNLRTGLRRGCKGRGMSFRCVVKDPQTGRAQGCMQGAHRLRDEWSVKGPLRGGGEDILV